MPVRPGLRRAVPALVAAGLLGFAGTGQAAPSAGPRIVPPADVKAEATGPGGAIVSYRPAKVSGAASVTYSKRSGTRFPLGTTVVVVTARDAGGHVATARFRVRVVDTTPPKLSQPADATAEATSAAGATVTYTAPTATDAVSGSLAVPCSRQSGGLFPIGATTVTCTATDRAKNHASVSFRVTVADTTPPTLDPHADQTVAGTSSGATVTYSAPGAHDTATAVPTVTCAPASGSTFPLGTSTVTCTARDGAGNTATSSFHVVVTAPAASAGFYSGTTSQGRAITFNVSDTGLSLSSVSIAFRADCSTVYFTGTLTIPFVSVGAGGTFSTTGTPAVTGAVSGSGQYTFTGSFSTASSAGSGTFVINISLSSPAESCTTGALTWSAARTGS